MIARELLLVVLAITFAPDCMGQPYGPGAEGVSPHQTRRAIPTTHRDHSLDALINRIEWGAISAVELQPLILHALTAQGDPHRPWNPAWGDLLETARWNGMVNDEDWKRYARQAHHYRIVARTPLRSGDPVPYVLNFERRVAHHTMLAECIQFGPAYFSDTSSPSPPSDYQRLNRNYVPWQPEVREPYHGQLGYHRDDSRVHPLDGLVLAPETAPATLRVPSPSSGADAVSLGIWGKYSCGMPVAAAYIPEHLKHAIIWEGVHEPTLVIDTLLPRDAQIVELVAPPEHAAAMKAVVTDMSVRRSNAAAEWLIIRLDFSRNPPLAGSFDVFLRIGENEQPLGWALVTAEGSHINVTYRVPLPRPQRTVERVDVVLRPNPTLILGRLNGTTVWGQPIEYTDVEVESREQFIERYRAPPGTLDRHGRPYR